MSINNGPLQVTGDGLTITASGAAISNGLTVYDTGMYYECKHILIHILVHIFIHILIHILMLMYRIETFIANTRHWRNDYS